MGRPKGSKNKKTLLKEGFTPEQLKHELAPYLPLHKCTMCGRYFQKPEKSFFSSKNNPAFRGNAGLVHICTSCVKTYQEEAKEQYGDARLAFYLTLQLVGHYFDPKLYDQFASRGVEVKLGDYLRALNGVQYRGKTGVTYLVEQYDKSKETEPTKEEYREEREVKWSKKDRQNKLFCLSVIQHDPFDGVDLSDEERKIAFGILANYLGDTGVADDNYKIQSVIEMTHLHMQCDRITKEISSALRAKTIDEEFIGKLTKTKTELLRAISTLAKDNNISSNYNNTNKAGSNTLTMRMKELTAEGVESLKPDLFDVKTCQAMKQIADLSNASIMEQLGFDAGEYANIIKEQREMVIGLNQEIDRLKEENRRLENEVIELKIRK